MFYAYEVTSNTYKNKVTSNLVVMSRKSPDNGELKCIVENNLGSDTSTLRIQIKGETF